MGTVRGEHAVHRSRPLVERADREVEHRADVRRDTPVLIGLGETGVVARQPAPRVRGARGPAAGQTAIERDLERVVIAHRFGQRQRGGAPARIELRRHAETGVRDAEDATSVSPGDCVPTSSSARSICLWMYLALAESAGASSRSAPATNSCSRVWPSAGSIA